MAVWHSQPLQLPSLNMELLLPVINKPVRRRRSLWNSLLSHSQVPDMFGIVWICGVFSMSMCFDHGIYLTLVHPHQIWPTFASCWQFLGSLIFTLVFVNSSVCVPEIASLLVCWFIWFHLSLFLFTIHHHELLLFTTNNGPFHVHNLPSLIIIH